jgi:hypothetical protein
VANTKASQNSSTEEQVWPEMNCNNLLNTYKQSQVKAINTSYVLLQYTRTPPILLQWAKCERLFAQHVETPRNRALSLLSQHALAQRPRRE